MKKEKDTFGLSSLTSVIKMEAGATVSSPVDTERQVESYELKEAQQCEDAKSARKNKSGALTCRMNTIIKLMADQANVDKVKDHLQKYIEALDKLNKVHTDYHMHLSKEERDKDTEQWYQPKMQNVEKFKVRTEEWIQSCPVVPTPEEEPEVSPLDSISVVTQASSKGTHAMSQRQRGLLFKPGLLL